MTKKFVFDEKKKKLKRKHRISDALLSFSFGTINKMCDLFLVYLLLGDAALTSGGLARRFTNNASRLLEEYPGVDIRHWLEGLNTVRRRRWIDGSLSLTEEGKKRLSGIIPQIDLNRHWDGNWYIVIFDIPERMRRKRNILRDKLKTLGFRKLQGSVWVSPFNLLGTVQKEVDVFELNPYVLCSQTAHLGEEDSRELAARIWCLDELQERYQYFLEQIAAGRIKNISQIFFLYLSIIREDPQLPEELLPNYWPGKEAHKYIRTFFARQGKSTELRYVKL